jgi:hydrogenase maturation protein HypF
MGYLLRAYQPGFIELWPISSFTCERIRAHEKINRVVLSGGVFQNIFLLSLAFDGLSHSGFEVIVHHRVPANDGGISLGQAVIAHMRYASCV